MTSEPLRFLLDEGVPRAVGRLLLAEGHIVIYLEEAVALGSEDQIVATAAIANKCILIALDGDMRVIAKRNGISNSRYKSLSLLKLSCNEVQAANRVKQFLPLISAEWLISEEKRARRLYIDIGDSRVIVHR